MVKFCNRYIVVTTRKMRALKRKFRIKDFHIVLERVRIKDQEAATKPMPNKKQVPTREEFLAEIVHKSK